VVIQMWDANADLGRDSKDLPCNTHVYLGVSYGETDRPNRLNMTVCCRSNDVIWGAYGANAVHFSFLQEYLAGRLGLDVGNLYQVSNNYHAYREMFNKTRVGDLSLWGPKWNTDPYDAGEVMPYPIVHEPSSWDAELGKFMASPTKERE